MTPRQKVALAEQAGPEYGLTPVLAALELPRSTFYYRRQGLQDRYAHLRPSLEAIARRHPEYGYRRTTVELQESYGHRVNHKVVQKLHRLWGLPLTRGTRHPKPSGIRRAIAEAGELVNLVARLSKIGPFQVAYTDFSELVYADGHRRAQLIAIPDHATRTALGWAVGERATTQLALAAWKAAKRTLAALGRHPAGMIIHHDQDPVFTSYSWTAQLLLRDGVRVSYSLDGARGNVFMESFYGRFKTENRSLFLDAQSLAELRDLVDERMAYFNHERRHSALDYQSPLTYLEGLDA